MRPAPLQSCVTVLLALYEYTIDERDRRVQFGPREIKRVSVLISELHLAYSRGHLRASLRCLIRYGHVARCRTTGYWLTLRGERAAERLRQTERSVTGIRTVLGSPTMRALARELFPRTYAGSKSPQYIERSRG
jgi:hypothetical protein